MRFFVRIVSCIYTACVVFLGVELAISSDPNNIFIRDQREQAVISENNEQVYVSGEIIGVYTECQGVFVIDTTTIENAKGELVSPAKDKVKKGDYILSINNKQVEDKEEVAKIVAKSKGERLIFGIMRDKKAMTVEITPCQMKNGSYMLGIWLKDDLAGVGTLTYVTERGAFGAFGHGMSNGETRDLLQVQGGDLYSTQILGIEKGKRGAPGELRGAIYYSQAHHLGSISTNENQGIFGTMDREDLENYESRQNLIAVAPKQDVEIGPAQIVSYISGERRTYNVKITYVDYLVLSSNKGIHIEVTDPELIALTGGIVQGMSGSPIIQNGKLVGAVTHVLINDPTKGYGIFIEDMMK